MDRNDRPGTRGNRRLDLTDIHQEILVADIDENRTSAENPNCRYGRHRCIRHGYHFIARNNSCRRKRNIERISSATDADSAGYPDIRRHLSFECDAFLTQNKLPGFKYTVYRRENLVSQFIILASIIPECW